MNARRSNSITSCSFLSNAPRNEPELVRYGNGLNDFADILIRPVLDRFWVALLGQFRAGVYPLTVVVTARVGLPSLSFSEGLPAAKANAVHTSFQLA